MKLLGKVVDNNDPIKAFRIKVSIPGFNSEIEVDNMVWYEQSATSVKNQTHLPDIGEYVEVAFDQSSISWSWPDVKDKELIDFIGNDYLTSLVISYRNLENQGHDGKLAVIWTKTDGLQVLFRDSKYQIRDDESLFIANKKVAVHLTKDGKISLGTEDKSAEPGVLGDKNFDALNALNDFIKDFANTVKSHSTELASIASPNPYTTALAPVFTKLAAELQAKHIAANYSKVKAKFPPTKSKIITLD